ncbi:rhomboid family intramembrane serine protease [Corynebacterium sp.]|uniref:rhomboid family intramembrane serine protease n=1 Tax=Corynebacterium sp. TaxID=1720 RepID=UPI0019B3A8EF|nr:rhomboid family intramembrane serine protease [Corynebacterium sp.]HHU66262.1 rhomboid family intramembrane serine protease [Corynebacterium sp.]
MYQPVPYPTAPPPSPRGGSALRSGLLFAGGYVLVIWAVHLINVLIFGGQLVFFGIHPMDVSSLWHIFTSPLLHANVEHLISNTIPGAVFSFLIGMSRARVWWEVTAIVVLVGGAGVWLLGGVGTNHIGASGLVYGWLGYLLVRGLFNRSVMQIMVGVGLGILYSGLVWGVFPGVPGLSWQAHLFGAVGGIAAGMFITSDDPPALREKKRLRSLQKGSAEGS